VKRHEALSVRFETRRRPLGPSASASALVFRLETRATARLVPACCWEQRLTFYKVKELMEGWQWVYENYIVPTRRRPENITEASRQLDDIIDA
jgi:hypothetical protein